MPQHYRRITTAERRGPRQKSNIGVKQMRQVGCYLPEATYEVVDAMKDIYGTGRVDMVRRLVEQAVFGYEPAADIGYGEQVVFFDKRRRSFDSWIAGKTIRAEMIGETVLYTIQTEGGARVYAERSELELLVNCRKVT